MTAEITRCAHRDTVVVIPHGSNQVVARICSACSESLPANWGCQECEWTEVVEFGGTRYLLLADTCDDHRSPEGII